MKHGLAAGMVGVHLALSAVGWCAPGADVLRGPIRGGFSVAEADRETGARKYALWGESATPLTADRWEIESPRLELYGEADTTNLVFAPTRCLFDRVAQRITSDAPLRMWSGDGYLQMQGEGFALDLEARQLWVSNQVSAVMNKRLFARESGLSKGSVPVGSLKDGSDVIRIQSKRLEYGNDRAQFLDAVRAEDGEGRVECRRLSVDLAPGAPDVQALRAAGSVRFVAGDLVVESEAADYDPVSGRLELTGNPRWVYREHPGHAQRVVLNREQRTVRAAGGIRLALPAGSVVLPGMPPRGSESGAGEEQAAKAVVVSAQTLDLQPLDTEAQQQLVLLKDTVNVEHGDTRLRSDELRVIVQGENFALARAKATGKVSIERGPDRMQCDQADYDAARGFAAFGGGVTWETEARSGEAEQVMLDLTRSWHRAEGGVRMRFARGIESWSGWFASGTDAGVGEMDAEGDGGWTEVASDRFEYRGGGSVGELQTAVYEGNVIVKQGDQVTLTCLVLRTELGPETNVVHSVTADGNVELRASDGNGYRLARGDRATYDAEEQAVVLSGRGGVDFFVIGASGVSRGTGRQAIYRSSSDTLVLAGDPSIATPEGELVGREVRLDRTRGVISATGPWKIRLPLGGYQLPQLPQP